MSDGQSAPPSRRAILKTGGRLIGAAAASSLGPAGAKAAGYPERPVKIIVPFAPAGPTDIMARILITYLGEAIGGNMIVENKPGAGGNIGIGAAAHAEPDGYTLTVGGLAPILPAALARWAGDVDQRKRLGNRAATSSCWAPTLMYFATP